MSKVNSEEQKSRIRVNKIQADLYAVIDKYIGDSEYKTSELECAMLKAFSLSLVNKARMNNEMEMEHGN